MLRWEDKRRFIPFIATAGLALVLLGCPEEEGPFEEAGEKIDEATENVRDAAEEAGEELKQ